MPAFSLGTRSAACASNAVAAHIAVLSRTLLSFFSHSSRSLLAHSLSLSLLTLEKEHRALDCSPLPRTAARSSWTAKRDSVVLPSSCSSRVDDKSIRIDRDVYIFVFRTFFLNSKVLEKLFRFFLNFFSLQWCTVTFLVDSQAECSASRPTRV